MFLSLHFLQLLVSDPTCICNKSQIHHATVTRAGPAMYLLAWHDILIYTFSRLQVWYICELYRCILIVCQPESSNRQVAQWFYFREGIVRTLNLGKRKGNAFVLMKTASILVLRCSGAPCSGPMHFISLLQHTCKCSRKTRTVALTACGASGRPAPAHTMPRHSSPISVKSGRVSHGTLLQFLQRTQRDDKRVFVATLVYSSTA